MAQYTHTGHLLDHLVLCHLVFSMLLAVDSTHGELTLRRQNSFGRVRSEHRKYTQHLPITYYV